MRIIILILLALFGYPFLLIGGTGEEGSRMDGFQVKVTSIDLIRSDDTVVNVYTGTSFLETVGAENGSIAGALSGHKPLTGSYKGIKLTTTDFRIKTALVISGTTYYTQTETLNEGDVWNLSSSESDYGFTTVQKAPESSTFTFPQPLIVESDKPVDLIWALQRNGVVQFDGTGSSDITWAQEENVIRAILPSAPSKWVKFDLKTTDGKSNTLSILLDGNGKILGGFCYRPENSAINGSWLSEGTLTSADNGVSGAFSLTYIDADDATPIVVDGSYSCVYHQYTITSVSPPVANMDGETLQDIVCRP
jgi:hypothetical protein